MCNMKTLALTVQNLWQRLKFLKSSSKVKVKGHKVKNFGSNGKVLSEVIYMCNMKGLALLVQKLWPKLKFLKVAQRSRSKVTWSKFLVTIERSSLGKYTSEI